MRGLTTLLPSCADCLDIWVPQPPGTLRACPDLYRDCFTFKGNMKYATCLLVVEMFQYDPVDINRWRCRSCNCVWFGGVTSVILFACKSEAMD